MLNNIYWNMKIDSNSVVFITGGQQGLGYASAKH